MKSTENCERLHKQNILTQVADRVSENIGERGLFTQFFDKDVWLIPVPGSAKTVKGALNIPLQLCREFEKQKLCSGILDILERSTTIRSSRFSGRGNRPSIQEHLDSIGIVDTNSTIGVRKILLIDDVVSKGRTLVASTIRLLEIFPYAEIKAFASARTLGFVTELEVFREPYVGVISYDGNDCRRG